MVAIPQIFSALTRRSILLFFGIVFISGTSNAQLDSIAISNVSFTQEFVTDSIGGTDTLELLQLEVYANDIDFLGEAIVVVYEGSSGYPLSMVKETKSEMEAADMISGSVISFTIAGLQDIVDRYRIEVQIRNFQGANLPVVTELY